MQTTKPPDENRTAAAPGWSLRAGQLAAAVAGLALLGAGCGSASRSPSSSTTPSLRSFTAAAYRYASCMRDHGLTNFPDPQIVNQPGRTGVMQAIPAGLAGTPQLKTGQTACRGILPASTNGDPAQLAAQQQARARDLLAFAKCLRGHGVPDFPDPTSQGRLTLQMVGAAGVDLHAPVVLTAAKACIGAANGAITGADVERAINGSR